jgi:hypothetical protein
MKTRRFPLCLALLLLAALCIAFPAQAGRTASGFVATNTSYWDNFVWHTAGNSIHRTNTFVEGITSPDARFRGTLNSQYECGGTIVHPNDPGIGWGPCNGNWRLDVPGTGGWWEGHANGLPQADYRVGVVKATGKGYGAFAGMKVQWDITYLWEWGVQRTVRITAAS